MPLVVVGIVGWLGLVWIGVRLAQSQAVGVGFDLRLLLRAGQHAAAGQSPYSSAMVSGASVEAQSLFYSYPPFVAQLLAPISWIPNEVVLVAWAVISTAAMAWVCLAVARCVTLQGKRLRAATVALPLVALAPFILPYGIGMLFGNLNTIFPFLYGLMLLAAAGGDRRGRIVGGIALGVAAATKLHPASLGLWFLVRGSRERRSGTRPESWEVVGVAALTVLGLVGFSLAVGGLQPWSDYLAVVRAGTAADLVDPRNMGPASQLGLAFGLESAAVRAVHLVVGVLAVVVTVWSAWSRRDPLESLGWAAVASLMTLPVTWYHYPAALIPLLVAAIARRPTVAALVIAAWGCAFVAIGIPSLLLIALGISAATLVKASTVVAATPSLMERVPG